MAQRTTSRLYPTDRGTSDRMRCVRSSDTRPELIVRRILRTMGYGYRLHRSDLPGRPDIVLSKHSCILFVHGCFWHRHQCPAGQSHPASNVEQWQAKFKRTVARDRTNVRNLRRLGWRVHVIWECQVADIQNLAKSLKSFLRRSSLPPPR